ncbi:hypothetical protein [Aquirhabdus sp.]|uniref:hypothetical protein n=1 Tax=Aquirhabdus sp. TaxID=2824160 RepID=UPI00396C5323
MDGGRYAAHGEMTFGDGAHQVGFFAQAMQRVQHLARPTNDPLAFRRDALKGAAALDDGDA